MSFSKANVLTLCGKLCLELENDTTISQYFNDTVERLALLPAPVFTKHALVSLITATATYDFKSDMLKLLHAIFDDASLFLTNEDGLEAYSTTWRSASGTPLAVTQDWLARQYTLYPNPDATSVESGAEPLGEGYPGDTLWIIYAHDRASSIQEYYALPLAILTLAREFSYSTLHYEPEFADQCSQLGQLILSLMGH
jgi:hypothetical protein